MHDNYGINIWGDNNFIIKNSTVNINYKNQPSLLEITHKIREEGYKGPLLLRFPHLIKKQISTLYHEFNRAREEFDYQGKFQAVFPLKVNQFSNFVKILMEESQEFNYGLEAGSKAELLIAMTHTPIGSPITVNGFKDKEMIALCFIASDMGHNITITIEGLGELETIVKSNEISTSKERNRLPKIGLRVRLHSSGIGVWAKSGGYDSKFGLNSTELLEAYDLIKEKSLLSQLSMIHFHIGSQMSNIAPLKKALREVGNIYADLKNRGAFALDSINIGGGLAIEYSQHRHSKEINYTLGEFANDVVFLIKEIAKNKGIDEPNIFTESGRFIASNHAVLIAPVLELFSQEYHQKSLRLKEKNPPLISELNDLWSTLNRANAREYLHDALDHMESLLTLFDLGYIDLEDRSNTEILVNLIIKKSIFLLKDDGTEELITLQNKIQERYLVNFSIFQSLPDFWGLGQKFPIMPIERLDTRATNPATLWDITCDSDGEIPFNAETPLYLHDVDITKDEYFLALFLTGAYQEVLGMRHNLFTHPTEATIKFNQEGDYTIEQLEESQNIIDVLDDMGYRKRWIDEQLREKIEKSTSLNKEDKGKIVEELYLYLSENSYLKTIQANSEE